MKNIIIVALIIVNTFVYAQTENVFLTRDFWKTNPTIEVVEKNIKDGNSATQLNRFGFDAVVYALLENADNKVIKHLLSKDGNGVNKLTHDGRTYIFWAAYKNNLDIVNYLLDNKAKTDVIDDKGYSILNFAAVAGVENTKLYDILIKHGADVKNEKTPKGANALLLMAPNVNDFKMIDYFVAKGLDLKSTDNNGNGAFNYTAQKDNREMLEQLIKKGLPYKEQTKSGDNAMLFATRGSRRGYNSLDYFKYLEGLGIAPNITNNKGETPLHNLSYRNTDVATFKYFIDKGVNVNQANKEGNTALLNASSRNNLEIIQLLASQTKNINHTNNQGQSVLTKAIWNSPEVVSFLIEKGTDVAIIDKKGNNLAYYLSQSFSPRDKDAFKKKLALLEEHGLKVSKPQANGNTLYHLAVNEKSKALLDFAKGYNVDINAKNKDGLTPLQLAVMTAKNDSLIKTLITEGADTKVQTDFNETLFDLASENEALKGVDLSFLK